MRFQAVEGKSVLCRVVSGSAVKQEIKDVFGCSDKMQHAAPAESIRGEDDANEFRCHLQHI